MVLMGNTKKLTYSFAARQFTVRLGDIDLSTDREASAPVTFKVSEVRAHPRFSRVGFYNDIAIMVQNIHMLSDFIIKTSKKFHYITST